MMPSPSGWSCRRAATTPATGRPGSIRAHASVRTPVSGPLRVGLPGQPSEVDSHGFGNAHQTSERRCSDRRIGIAVLGEILHPGHESLMGSPRRQGDLVVILAQRRDQALHRSEQAFGDGPGHIVEALHGAVDRVGPLLQVAAASGLADRSGRVLTVVARQIEIGDMQKRTAPVILQLSIDDSSPILEGGEMGVDQRVGDPRSSEAGERAVPPLGDRSWTTPSYSWAPPSSRVSGMNSSLTARIRPSTAGTLPAAGGRHPGDVMA